MSTSRLQFNFRAALEFEGHPPSGLHDLHIFTLDFAWFWHQQWRIKILRRTGTDNFQAKLVNYEFLQCAGLCIKVLENKKGMNAFEKSESEIINWLNGT